MPLDMNKPLPMTDGHTPGARVRSGGRAVLLVLALLAAAGGVLYFVGDGDGAGERIRDGVGAVGAGANGVLHRFSSTDPGDGADADAADRHPNDASSPAVGQDEEGDAVASTGSSSAETSGGSTGAPLLPSEPEQPAARAAGGGAILPDEGERTGPAGTASAEPVSQMRRRWEQVKEIEASGDTEALRTELKAILSEHRDDRHGAAALYRLGVLAWTGGDRKAAVEHWTDAYSRLGRTGGGRRAALVLADLWYARYCEAANPAYENWEAVRDAYSTAVGKDKASFLTGRDRLRARERLMRLNDRLVFSPAPCRDAEYYTVREGDTLGAIAKRYEVHYDGIAALNGVRRGYIRNGQRLKIIRFSSLETEAVVDKERRVLTLYHKGKWLKEYPVCHGGEKTVPGVYTVVSKAPDPTWTDPETGKEYASNHPKNILGDRWLGFDGSGPAAGIGIHGTTLPESIPGTSSNGCIRMHNADVKEVYGVLIRGSKVTILE